VTNLGMGGITSDVSTMIMEYNFFPEGYLGPDVILWDHGVNEAVLLSEEIIQEHLRRFQEATRAISCNPSLPLVAYIDSLPMTPNPKTELWKGFC